MVKAPFDPGQLIDLERFPIHDLDRSLGCDFLRECQAELDATGGCNLAGFVRDRAIEGMVAEALELVSLAYRKDTRRNAYFTQDDPALQPDHPLRRLFPRRMAQLANDVIPKNATITWRLQQAYVPTEARSTAGRSQ